MDNSVFENVRKHKDIKPERRVYYLISEPNFHTTKFFTEKLLAIKMKKKTKIRNWMNFSIKKIQ